jgi:hypothetical protein
MIAGMRTTRQALLGDTVVHYPQKLYFNRWQGKPTSSTSTSSSSTSSSPSIIDRSALEVVSTTTRTGTGPSSTVTTTSSTSSLGDNNTTTNSLPLALPGFVMSKPMLFATIYPLDSGDFDEIRKAVNKLTLNDASVTVGGGGGGSIRYLKT